MPSPIHRFAALTCLASVLLLTSCGSDSRADSSFARQAASYLTPGQDNSRLQGSTAAPAQDVEPVAAVTAPAGPLRLHPRPEVHCDQAKCVALTFDDGPGRYTETLLDSLAAADVPATFYLLGQNAGKYPHALRRMVLEGHQLGSHTQDHASLTTLSRSQITHEIDEAASIIKDVSGVYPGTVRPPYGAHNAEVDSLIDAPLVLWDVDTLDWQHRDSAKVASIAMSQVRDGSIILMHDIHQSTVKAVPELIKQLKAKGYTPVTVDELFDGQEFNSSTAYSRRNQIR
ncbi:polysaccharide deacetylase family protein [Glutamicibacter sp. NPDC087344]|uniref:polysaccharide deacetylase family protein n=1 Tax=Glutamicibacter sp. NPDC087344 TaxID=3363994 RepID=UPI00380691BD